MNKILTTDDALELGSKLSQDQRRIVLAGGCFDILHIGHITFFEQAKQHADTLCLFLEADETIAATKGHNRPVNTQVDRAKMLSALALVDYIILLPPGMTDEAYDTLVFAIKPAIIATTKGDTSLQHKARQAEAIGAQILEVGSVQNQSTTRIVKILNEI